MNVIYLPFDKAVELVAAEKWERNIRQGIQDETATQDWDFYRVDAASELHMYGESDLPLYPDHHHVIVSKTFERECNGKPN